MVAQAEDPAPAKDEPETENTRAKKGDSSPAAEGDQASDSAPKGRQTLEIAELRLCGKVHDFGSFDALNPDALKAGQILAAYWEFTGLEFEPRGDSMVARLSSHLELRPETGGPIVWEQTSQAEYVCRRPRRDNYANHRIQLPKSLEPGPYRLRLIQTDLIAGRTASIDLRLTVTP